MRTKVNELLVQMIVKQRYLDLRKRMEEYLVRCKIVNH